MPPLITGSSKKGAVADKGISVRFGMWWFVGWRGGRVIWGSSEDMTTQGMNGVNGFQNR